MLTEGHLADSSLVTTTLCICTQKMRFREVVTPAGPGRVSKPVASVKTNIVVIGTFLSLFLHLVGAGKTRLDTIIADRKRCLQSSLKQSLQIAKKR